MLLQKREILLFHQPISPVRVKGKLSNVDLCLFIQRIHHCICHCIVSPGNDIKFRLLQLPTFSKKFRNLHFHGIEGVKELHPRIEGFLHPCWRSDFLIDCDVSDMAALDKTFETLAARWPTIDFVVHAIGFSDKNELRGGYVDTSLDNFLLTMNVSVYSFVAVTHRARAMMPNGGALLTLSYYGAEKVIPHYNVMGVAKAALETSVKYLANDLGPTCIRVNAISAGPIKTLAASGIGDFRYIMKWNEYNSPLRRNVTIEDVGNVAAFLLSDLAAGVSAEITYVDGGFSQVMAGSGNA